MSGLVDDQERLEALRPQSWSYDQAIEQARAAMAQAQSFGTRRLGKFAGLTLYEHALVTPNGQIDLETESVQIAVETAGNLIATQRSTLTRMAIGGMTFGLAGGLMGGMLKKTKIHDTRELYILVESDRVASVVRCDPDKGVKARRFITSVVNTARGAPERCQQREAVLPGHQAYVDDLVLQRAQALSSARAALAQG